MKKSKTRLPTLADQFDLAEAFLASPDAAALKSALIRATNRSTGDPVLLKYWEKAGAPIDADLRALWRHEMRQVERVRAFPGADEVIVDILNYGEASDAFFVATSGEFAP